MKALEQVKPLLNRRPLQWAGITAGFVLWTGSFVGWALTHNRMELRNQLMYLNPIFLWFGFMILAIALWCNRMALWKMSVTSFTRKQWICAACAGLLAFALAHGVAPRTHRLFFDEDIYEAIALNIMHNGRAAMNSDGRWDFGRFYSPANEYNKQPNGWPFLIHLAYRFFGISENVAFNLSNFLFVVAVLLVFVTGRLLFESPLAGFCGALIYALTPENILWYSTVDCDPPTACFTLLALALTLFFFRQKSSRALFLMSSAWAIAAQFRFEVILMVGLVFIMFYVEGWKEFEAPRLYGFFILFLVLLFAHLLQFLAVRGETWGSSGSKLSLTFLGHNFRTNSLYYLDGKRYPWIFTLLAFTGLGFRGLWKAKLYVVLWFLLTWTIFLLFYAGSYQFGADVRFSLMSLAAIAVLAGRGVEQLVAAGGRYWPVSNLYFTFGLLLVGHLAFYMPHIRAESGEGWQSRTDHAVAEQFASFIPSDGIVLTQDPNMFQIWGKSAAQTFLISNNFDYFNSNLKPQFGDQIYFHWNYWCNVQDPGQVALCQAVLDKYETQLIVERRVRDQRFALYRVLGERRTR